MIAYRSFRNGDTPQLVDIWRAQPRQRGLAQPMSVELIEQHVLAKPYFDNRGLVIAFDGARAVGFAHAGFGANDDESGLCARFGVTNLLLLRPDYLRSDVGRGLLTGCEHYLTEQGAEVLYAGGIRPLDPFYTGLYGGSEAPGVLRSDPVGTELYAAAGYRPIDRVAVLNRELAGFRAPIDRVQMQIRRTYVVEQRDDPPPRTWWEACEWDLFHVIRFALAPQVGAPPVATAYFWLMNTYSGAWGVHAAGLYRLDVEAGLRRRGLATFLLSEAFRRLAAGGVTRIEAQTMAVNAAALALYARLGFRQVDEGIVYRRDLAAAQGPSSAAASQASTDDLSG